MIPPDEVPVGLESRARENRRSIKDQLDYERCYTMGYHARYDSVSGLHMGNVFPKGSVAAEGFDNGWAEAAAMA